MLICFYHVHSFFSRLLEVDPVIIRLERMTVVTFSSPSGESGSQANLGERMGREKKGREDERNVWEGQNVWVRVQEREWEKKKKKESE